MEKQMIRNVLKTLISFRAALVATLGIPLVITLSANAQAPEPSPDAGTATAGAVIVTGSNIPTAEEVTPSNVDTLTDHDVQRSGQAGDILQVLTKTDPDFTGAGNLGSTNANIESGITYGGSSVSIRGLPALVLLDGRRLSDSAAIAAGGAQFTDVSIFPTALISRIEVLKDGASALYGSEAVGGVVNVFLKSDFTGLEIGTRYGFSVESGVAERRDYVIAGIGNETTHVTAAFQYYEIDRLYTRERGYSAGVGKGGATTTYAGSVRDASGARDLLQTTLNTPFQNPGLVNGSVASLSFTDPAFAGAYNAASTAQVIAFDLSKIPTSTQKQRNTDEYASFTHDIFGKQLEVFGDMMYANNNNFSQLNGQPLSNATGVVILGTERIDPLTGATVAENRGGPAGFNPFPLSIDGNALPLTVGNRYQDHPRTFEDTSDLYRLLGGLRSQINKDWFAEGAVYYSHYTIDYVNGGLVNAVQLNDLIAGTAPGFENQYFDFFARNPVGETANVKGALPLCQAAFDSYFGDNIRKLDSYQKAFDARITGFPFELPGGGVGVSVGAEYRDEGFKVADSPEIFVGSVPIGIIDVGRGISSYYGEVRIPVVGSEMQVPWVYSLELSAAGRHDHYEGVIQDANVPKFTLRYQPIKDLTIRATYSDSFVAPTLYQLFGPQSEGFSPTIALNGITQDQAQVLTGSNPNLLPSTAESYTAGLVYSPSWLPGLTVTGDFFKTLQQGIVGTIGAQTILSSVNSLGPASPYASQVSFNNFPGFIGARPVTGTQQLVGNLQSVFYTDLNRNLGAERSTGIDTSIRYLWDLKSYGQLELGANAVYFLSQDFKNFPFTDFYTINGAIGDEAFGAFPIYKVTMLAEYRVMGFTLSMDGTYIPGMHNELLGDITTGKLNQLDENESYFIADGRLSYEFKRTPQPIAAPMGKDAKDSKGVAAGTPGVGALTWGDKLLDGLRLTGGCNNQFDDGTPTVAGGNSNTNLATYDPYGRFVYFEVAHKF